jgi:hypothetical protein
MVRLFPSPSNLENAKESYNSPNKRETFVNSAVVDRKPSLKFAVIKIKLKRAFMINMVIRATELRYKRVF